MNGEGDRRRAARRCAWAAALAYLALAMWSMGGVLGAPASTLLGAPPGAPAAALNAADQRMVLSVVTRNARLVAERPWDLVHEGHCYPTPRSYTLGEHMFGNGLLAALPLLATGEPILAYNAMLVLTLWIPALAMYLLSFHFTRSAPAAFVAGLVFAMSRDRLMDPAHPYVHGDLWTPLALLCLYRLFDRGDWRSALGLSLFLSLEVLESLYALLSSAIIVGVVGVSLTARNVRRLPGLAVKIVVCVLAVGAVAWWVLGPYLETASTWGVLSRAASLFAYPSQFAIGERYFPGLTAVALALLALLDRLRGPRAPGGRDPRLVFALAGFVVLWSSTYGLRIPVLDVLVPSPLVLLRDVVPGLSAVRVLAAVRIGVQLAVAFLAGYGVVVLTERLGVRARVATASVLSLLVLLEVFHPRAARFSFGSPTEHAANAARPPEEDLSLVRASAGKAVLDLPYTPGNIVANAHSLLFGAFHGRRVAACYNSFRLPLQDQMAALAEQLPDPAATEALGALGFDTVFVHRHFKGKRALPRFERELAAGAAAGKASLLPLGETNRIRAYRIVAPEEVDTSVDLLAAGQAPSGEVRIGRPHATLEFAVANPSGTTFRHPDPIAPSDLTVGWLGEDGERKAESHVRALLPLAVAAHGVATIPLDLDVPVPPGRYVVTLAHASSPRRIIGRQPAVVE